MKTTKLFPRVDYIDILLPHEKPFHETLNLHESSTFDFKYEEMLRRDYMQK